MQFVGCILHTKSVTLQYAVTICGQTICGQTICGQTNCWIDLGGGGRCCRACFILHREPIPADLHGAYACVGASSRVEGHKLSVCQDWNAQDLVLS
jgi:hypothetical protein